MPRITDTENHNIGNSGFSFSGTTMEKLANAATEYTLVDIMVDVTGSTGPFASQLREMLIAAVEACRKSPKSENLLIRVSMFSTAVGIHEIHGYVLLSDIKTDDYPQFHPAGATNLNDAGFSSIGSLHTYGSQLYDEEFTVNAISIQITDGKEGDGWGNPVSTVSASMIGQKIREIRIQEKLESIVSIVIGINTAQFGNDMEQYRREAGVDKFIDAGEVTPQRLAKIADFVSQSISSQSVALGTGGPSQAISATI